ncbi:MAG TPA: hypothetical protein VFS58_04755 [Steroidobacteraceae bacterium]|nr:hypothetical protein [Steroidobacteraceae bacterium]
MRISRMLIGIAAATVLAAGCASQEEPAKAAVASAEAALAEVLVDATKYAPEELQAAEASLAKAKTDLAKGDYKDVLSASTQINQQVATLKEIVVSRQTQAAAATNEWESLRVEVPKMVKAIEYRVDMLSGSAKLPKDMNKEVFESAKVALQAMKTTWAEASAAFAAGNVTDAADKARQVQVKAEEVAGQLGISPI